MKRPPVKASPSVAFVLRDVVNEVENPGAPSLMKALRQADEERRRKRRAAWQLIGLTPLVVLSIVFHATAPRLLGIEEPAAVERHRLLVSELELLVEEIEAYREEHEVLVSDLTAIDRYYGEGVRFEALNDHEYRLTLTRDGETIAYTSESESSREGGR